MTLHYLVFDASDDGNGHGSWEATASVRADRLAPLMAEAQAVLQAAERSAPGMRGPLEEGGAWDAELHTQPEGDWTVLTLTLTGPWAWGEALLQQLQDAP